ncbi:GH1 family beta-glucosidase [Modestobacter sp. VKM Ac-2986]|uniref:GH1 family beta-glucosidase n=1 Tax=Modestobacter sp. VKM Ac-2986 TaxID=3004140 RepID=UPI0022AB9FDB|nr:GH1 family beta-glucosidase [Modestobacter sp. VKM Ac-2986]MCZ2829923.1 GH1 family beta-glucosidase [Modestobacter sp. VKM Ac-2986]
MTSTDVRSAPSGLVLPPGFAFGAATAAYQIEGAHDVDGRGPSIWDTYSHTPGKTFNGDTGDVAVEHYTRYPQDVALMKDLGLDAYRFSVSWPRVLPAGKGAIEQRGLDFYRRLVDEVLEAGIAPWLTLYHWDLPQALEDEGGWTNRDTAHRFADYAGIVYDALGDRVPHWSTLNEPMCSSLLGYQAGAHAPGHTNSAEAAKAVHHLLLGHGLATQVMRDKGADHLGITLNFTPMSPASDSAVDVDAARRQDGQQNRMFITPIVTGEYPADVVEDLVAAGAPLPVQDGDLEIISTPVDWLGVNYYYAAVVSGGHEPKSPSTFIGCEDVREEKQDGPTTTMGWSVNPDSFTELLNRLSAIAPGLPMFITENGSAWPDEVAEDGQVHDQQRVDYLHDHLAAMATAIEAGADVRGYFAWSLLDNYEWARGYAQRFGIVHVDYETQVRTPKDSAHAYAEVIRQHKAGA